jgi:hypothetical protein
MNDPTFPVEKTYRTRFKNQGAMMVRLAEWTIEKPAWSDVRGMLSVSTAEPVEPDEPAEPTASSSPHASTFRLTDNHVPPVIDALHELAVGDRALLAECEQRGLDVNVEFERRVGIALRLLGLEVEKLGQGSGRVADGIARYRPGRWALIYDAKLRRAGFVLGTEDRKFREYVEHHGRQLSREGIDSIYFGVVSSSFARKDLDRAQQLVHITLAKAVPLIEARTLRYLVDLRLRGELDDMQRMQRILGITQILSVDSISDALR